MSNLTKNEIEIMISNRVAVLTNHLVDTNKVKNDSEALEMLIKTKTYNNLLTASNNFYWISTENIIFRLDEELAGNVLIMCVYDSDIPKEYIDKIIDNHVNFVIANIVLQEGISHSEALIHFKKSTTYKLLQNLESKLYFEVSEYILCMYSAEIRGDW